MRSDSCLIESWKIQILPVRQLTLTQLSGRVSLFYRSFVSSTVNCSQYHSVARVRVKVRYNVVFTLCSNGDIKPFASQCVLIDGGTVDF